MLAMPSVHASKPTMKDTSKGKVQSSGLLWACALCVWTFEWLVLYAHIYVCTCGCYCPCAVFLHSVLCAEWIFTAAVSFPLHPFSCFYLFSSSPLSVSSIFQQFTLCLSRTVAALDMHNVGLYLHVVVHFIFFRPSPPCMCAGMFREHILYSACKSTRYDFVGVCTPASSCMCVIVSASLICCQCLSYLWIISSTTSHAALFVALWNAGSLALDVCFFSHCFHTPI